MGIRVEVGPSGLNPTWASRQSIWTSSSSAKSFEKRSSRRNDECCVRETTAALCVAGERKDLVHWEGSDAELAIQSSTIMQLFVRSPSGRTIVVAVDVHATIEQLTMLCEEKENHLHPFGNGIMDSRYLWYGGVPLRPQRTLADYGIQNHTTLESCVRLRGGCFIFSILLWIIIFILCLLSLCTCGLSLPVAFALVPIALLLPLCCL